MTRHRNFPNSPAGDKTNPEEIGSRLTKFDATRRESSHADLHLTSLDLHSETIETPCVPSRLRLSELPAPKKAIAEERVTAALTSDFRKGLAEVMLKQVLQQNSRDGVTQIFDLVSAPLERESSDRMGWVSTYSPTAMIACQRGSKQSLGGPGRIAFAA